MSVALDDKKAYQKLMQKFPPRPIHSDEDNEQVATIIDSLIDNLRTLSPAEKDYLEVLTILVEKYESTRDKPARFSPRELVCYLMEVNDLGQKDLIDEFGSASRVSEFLSGHRDLSIEQARKLAFRFSLSLDALLN